MPMIRGIDGSTLLQAMRAGRQDRAVYDRMKAEREAQQQEAERRDQVTGLVGQIFGGGQGVAAQVAPQGQPSAAATPAAGMPAQAAQPPARRPNPEVLAQLVALDPEVGGKIVSALKTLDESTLKQYENKNTVLGAAAQFLSRYPEAERAQLMQVVAPQLVEAGWTPEELQQADLTDAGLQGYQALAMDVDTMVDNELAEREFNAGKVTPVQENGMLIRTKPDGTSDVIAAPAGYQGGDLPSPASPEEAQALGPGAQWRAPDGSIRTNPGGGGGNATGSFQGGGG